MTIEAVFQQLGKYPRLKQTEKRATKWDLIKSKEWLSQMDEIPSEPADLERRTLSKACLTSEGRTRYSVEERGASQKVVEESRADL
jgi:hypothetical protein